MVKNKFAEEEVQSNGWLLDGYPRSGEQAEAIEKEGIRPDVFLLINVRPRAGAVGRERMCAQAMQPACSLLLPCPAVQGVHAPASATPEPCGRHQRLATLRHSCQLPDEPGLPQTQVPDALLIDRVVGRRSDPGEHQVQHTCGDAYPPAGGACLPTSCAALQRCTWHAAAPSSLPSCPHVWPPRAALQRRARSTT